jgi:hypothetical protein
MLDVAADYIGALPATRTHDRQDAQSRGDHVLRRTDPYRMAERPSITSGGCAAHIAAAFKKRATE